MKDDRNQLGAITRRSLLARAGLAAAGVAAAGSGARWLGSPAAAEADARWLVPAEDGPHARTWMAWPSSASIWGRQLRGVQADVARVAREIARYEPVVMCAANGVAAASARHACGPSVSVISSIPVNDCWIRDSGPVFRTSAPGDLDAISLNFNGWGSKQAVGKDRDVARRVAARVRVDVTRSTVVGEGGGVEHDGDGTLMATESCWVNANRNPGRTRAQIESELLSLYGAAKMIWVSKGVRAQDITDGHIDSAARFVRPGVVMVQLPPAYRTDVWAADARAQHRALLKATDARGRRLKVLTVEGPDTLPRWPRNRWDTFLDSYVNWAVTNGAVITAQFGDHKKDAAAKAAIAAAFPRRVVVQLNVDHLHGNGGGGIHCITQQEPRRPILPSVRGVQ